MSINNCLSCTFCPETWIKVTKEIGGGYPHLYHNSYSIPQVIEWQNGCRLTYDRNLDNITEYNPSFGYPLVLIKTSEDKMYLENPFQAPILISNNCKSYTTTKLEDIIKISMPPITLRILEKSKYNTTIIPKWLQEYHNNRKNNGYYAMCNRDSDTLYLGE